MMWREVPSCFREDLALAEAAHLASIGEVEILSSFRAKREEFLLLEAAGWRKFKHEHEHDAYPVVLCQPESGYKSVIHGWVSPEGKVAHMKFKDDRRSGALSNRRDSLAHRRCL